MTTLRISLGFLLALTLACALEKDNLSAANDAQPVNVAHAQEDGIKDAVKASWPFHAVVRRHRVTGPNERRNDGDVKEGVRSEKTHRRVRRAYDSDSAVGWTIGMTMLFIILPFIIILAIFASVGIGLCCYFKNRQNNQPAYPGRVIQPAQPSAYRAHPMSQPQSE
ncbi:hypothetical protein AAVH_06081 [Aphelenchoides avenae]|nr:hypothetical protein AAVH_06081 [Aphelenchus avenae]